MLRHEGSDGKQSDCINANYRIWWARRQQYERNIQTESSNCAPGRTGREQARKEVEVQPLWPTRQSLKEVAGEAGCSLEAD